jgi:hypothetical protein
MRAHLITMLEQKKISAFPKLADKAARRFKVSTTQVIFIDEQNNLISPAQLKKSRKTKEAKDNYESDDSSSSDEEGAQLSFKASATGKRLKKPTLAAIMNVDNSAMELESFVSTSHKQVRPKDKAKAKK